MADPVISVNSLVKTFGSFTAVDHISFSVKPGTIFGLLGANGAGKTTTIRILCGLMKASGGEVRLADVDVLASPEKAKLKIGYMSQRFSLYRDLSVEENLEFFGGLYGVENTASSIGRRAILKEVGLEGYHGELAGNLPGGVTQRLALACAMSHRPAVLFLDEPTAGVDPVSRRRFWDLIHKAAEAGTTVIVTTHYLDEAEYCDHIVLMHNGLIAASGSPDEMKRNTITGLVVEMSGVGGTILERRLEQEHWVTETSLFGDALHLQIDGNPGEAEVQRRISRIAQDVDCPIPTVEAIIPSLEDVFLRIIDAVGDSV